MFAPPPDLQERLEFDSGNPETWPDLVAGGPHPHQPMWGDLWLPETSADRKEGYPAVIFIHGSLNYGEHHEAEMAMLNRVGIATMKVYTFDARGVTNTVERQVEVTDAQWMNDAFQALDILSAHPKIDPARIGITGHSKGGMVAVYSALESLAAGALKSKSTEPRRSQRFAAHFSLYPGAAYVPLPGNVCTGSPVEIHTGEAEDYTWSAQCDVLAEVMNSVGAVDGGKGPFVRSVTYPGAYHSFDREEPVSFLPEAVKFSEDARIGVDERGELFVPVGSRAAKVIGVSSSPPSPPGWVPLEIDPDCYYFEQQPWIALIDRGGHLGGDPVQGPKVRENMKTFFKITLGLASR